MKQSDIIAERFPTLAGRLELAIDRLIDLLDEIGGDADFEPDADGEPDTDREPSLGWASPR